MTYILDHDLIGNAAATGAYFLDRLRELKDRHPIVGDVRGLGLMVGLEFVQDRETRAPFPVSAGVARRIADATFARGLLSYPGQGTADGTSGDHIMYAPPLTITPAQVDDLISILDESLTEVEAVLAEDLAA